MDRKPNVAIGKNLIIFLFREYPTFLDSIVTTTPRISLKRTPLADCCRPVA
jgi:hypothetical protein